MLNIPPGKYGHEFYAVGDTRVLADVCLTANWDKLRSGEITIAQAIFPICVHSLDILLLPESISLVTGVPVYQHPDDELTIAGVEGLWGACIVPRGFVAAIASIPLESAAQLQNAWMTVHIREYDSESDLELVIPDWSSGEMLKATTALLRLAHMAVCDDLDVVEIWTL